MITIQNDADAMIDRITLETDRLLISACTRNELLNIYRGSVKDMQRAKHWPLDELKEALPHFLNDLQDDPSNYGWNVYLISTKKDGIIVGDIGFKGSPDSEGRVAIGYSIAPGERGKGYAREAVTTLCENAFKTGRVNVIEAECHRHNPSSARVLASCGFEIVGRSDEMMVWERRE